MNVTAGLVVDGLLVAGFGAQHSALATVRTKTRARRRFGVDPLEWRTVESVCNVTYVLVAAALWRHVGGTVWDLRGVAGGFMWALVTLSWIWYWELHLFEYDCGLAFGSTALVSRLAGQPVPGLVPWKVGSRRWIRFPVHTAFFGMFFLLPRMTADLLVLAVVLNVYNVVGSVLYDKRLQRLAGDAYARYQAVTGLIFPPVYRAPRGAADLTMAAPAHWRRPSRHLPGAVCGIFLGGLYLVVLGHARVDAFGALLTGATGIGGAIIVGVVIDRWARSDASDWAQRQSDLSTTVAVAAALGVLIWSGGEWLWMGHPAPFAFYLPLWFTAQHLGHVAAFIGNRAYWGSAPLTPVSPDPEGSAGPEPAERPIPATLGLPSRRRRGEHPFWHRPAPALTAVRLDPDFAALRSELPDGWESLVRLKYVLDALTTVARTPGWTASDPDGGGPHLFDAIARHLDELSSSGAGGVLRRQAATAADSVRVLAGSGHWPPVELEPPLPGELWMHFGPLRPWAMQASPQPLALLVGCPQPVAQQVIDRVTRHTAARRERVEWVLSTSVRPPSHRPAMSAVDLLLAGGSPGSGHKNFAHFFPLESPPGKVSGGDFSVVFANVHSERLNRCSLRLLAAVGGRPPEVEPGDVGRASLTWFRSHDLAHFWRPDSPSRSRREAFAPFEEMVLEEALADTLGLLSVVDLEDAAALGAAFSAEMLRYLSRNHHEFADTTAAALEVGWLAAETDLDWAQPQKWLAAALPSFTGLARDLRAALDGSAEPIGRLRRALEEGRRLVARWYGPLADLPTDLEYSFG